VLKTDLAFTVQCTDIIHIMVAPCRPGAQGEQIFLEDQRNRPRTTKTKRWVGL
jgi:hypothetical protein